VGKGSESSRCIISSLSAQDHVYGSAPTIPIVLKRYQSNWTHSASFYSPCRL